MSISYEITAAHFPKEVRTHRNPYLPYRKHEPYLEQKP